VLFMCSSAYLWGASLLKEELITLVPGTAVYKLSSSLIINGSESLRTEDMVLERDRDYRIDYRLGRITLLRELSIGHIFASYVLIPSDFSKPKALFRIRAETDSVFKTIQARSRTSWWQNDGKLQINGSKTFAVSFSDDEAFDLKQSLYVNLSGELAEGVSITAQLSDSQSKLSPEGDSRELSSLDQVFIKVNGKSWELGMGDLELKYQGSRYMDYYSRFEGVNARLGSDDYLQAAYSAGGAKNTRTDINIIDGKQGPYYLNPGGQPGSLIVVAGSETVYRNGSKLERGSDYYIDYSEGTLMFRELMYSTDMISVWFQYSDENYPRHSILSSSSWQAMPGFTLSHRLISATDSKDNPLLYEFTAADLDSLAQAGDDDAWGNGATLVEPGQGSYRLFTNAVGLSYYEYAQSDSLADYLVVFSFVGMGRGDYEQYSSGKFRYVGPGLGEWLPQKRLVAASSAINTALRAGLATGNWDIGTEAVLAIQDDNTFSRLDDDDNRGTLIYSWLKFMDSDSRISPYLNLEYEKRWAGTKLLSDYSSLVNDYDLGAAFIADSLALDSYGMKIGFNLPGVFKPELSLRHQSSGPDFKQNLLRFLSSSRQWYLLPRMEVRSSLARVDNQVATEASGLSLYNHLDGNWTLKTFKLGALYNQQSFIPSQSGLRSDFYRLNPYLELGNTKSVLTRLALSSDINRTGTSSLTREQRSDTWSLKQLLNTANHNLNLDYSHRRISSPADSSNSSYDLIALRTNDSFLKRALVLITNYQLNQTEFFPRIRDLQYIGDGLGVYDSTGVVIPEGDWDYVYITSSTGTLSSELNAQASLYIKPGNLTQNDLLRRISSDVIFSGSEQKSSSDPDPLSYMFWPGTVFDPARTIYGKQGYQQNIWLELIRNKVTNQISIDWDRTLDNRYQEQSRTSRSGIASKLDFNRIGDYSLSLTADYKQENDSRYDTELSRTGLSAFIQRNLGRSSTLRFDAHYFDEQGKSTGSNDSYSLAGLGVIPSFRSVWGAKGRISGSINLQYNRRGGDELLSFLPEKRAGAIIGFSINAIYRLNAFSTASLDYSASSYPGEKVAQQLKLEFKAEL